jgi:hypothetical protein
LPRPAFLGALLLASTLSGSLGCAAGGELFRDPADTVAPLIRPDSIYEALSDHYVEMCVVSQYHLLEGDLGGIPGHAVMYLKGACREESAPYPRMRPCRYATFDPKDPGYGAGVSVNRWFKNVNWIATPGVLLKTLPVLQVNALYDTKFRLFFLGGFFTNNGRNDGVR